MQAQRWTGVAALLAAAAWLSWAVLNAWTRGALDGPRDGPQAAWAWAGTMLLVAATAGVIPAALALGHAVRARAPAAIVLVTAAGVLSLALWAAAAAFRWWPPALEPGFIALSAVWWLGLGAALWPERRALAVLTALLGVAAALDATVTAFEPRLPAWAFPVLGGPKLPLQMIWTLTVGVVLVRWRSIDRRAEHVR
jgi:hypothetical protein